MNASAVCKGERSNRWISVSVEPSTFLLTCVCQLCCHANRNINDFTAENPRGREKNWLPEGFVLDNISKTNFLEPSGLKATLSTLAVWPWSAASGSSRAGCPLPPRQRSRCRPPPPHWFAARVGWSGSRLLGLFGLMENQQENHPKNPQLSNSPLDFWLGHAYR